MSKLKSVEKNMIFVLICLRGRKIWVGMFEEFILKINVCAHVFGKNEGVSEYVRSVHFEKENASAFFINKGVSGCILKKCEKMWYMC